DPLDQLQRGLDAHVRADQGLLEVLDRPVVKGDLVLHRVGDLFDDLRMGHEQPALQLAEEPGLLLLGKLDLGRELQDVVGLGGFFRHGGAHHNRTVPSGTFSAYPTRTVRIWLKRLVLAILLLTGVYLVGINLFLNSPLAPRAFNRRPAKFRIAWSAAWTVWPGLVQVRGLRLWGHVNSTTWTVDAERARGWINLGTLPGRTFRVTELHAEGVRSTVLRGPEQETAEDRREAAEPETPEDRSYQPWTLRFERITLEHVRELAFNDFRITG